MAQGKSVTIDTAWPHTCGVVHDFQAPCTCRKFLKSDRTRAHGLIADVSQAVLLPSAVVVCRCSAHTNLCGPSSHVTPGQLSWYSWYSSHLKSCIATLAFLNTAEEEQSYSEHYLSEQQMSFQVTITKYKNENTFLCLIYLLILFSRPRHIPLFQGQLVLFTASCSQVEH